MAHEHSRTTGMPDDLGSGCMTAGRSLPSKLVILSPTLSTGQPATGLTMTTWSQTTTAKQVAGLGQT